MAKKITKEIIKETMDKINSMSKDDCKKFFTHYKIDIGFTDSDYDEITEEDLRNVVIEELELVLEDIEDEEDDDNNEIDEIDEIEKEEKKLDKPKKDKKELSKPKSSKKNKGQSEPTKKLEEGKAYILEREDGVRLYPTLEPKTTNYPILESDVEIEIEINGNIFKAFDDGKYISFQVNGRWCAILNKYIPTDKKYTVITDGIPESIADYVDDLINGNQSESDWTPKNIKPQPVKRPKKVKKEGRALKEDKNQKTLTEMVDETPVVEEEEEIEEEVVKADKPKKDKSKKDKKDKSKKDKKDKSKKDKKISKETKTTKSSKK
jgi:hypothetical protein